MRQLLAGVLLTMLTLVSAPNASALTILAEESTPAIFYNEDGVLTGLFVDMVNELKRRTGSQAQVKVMPWARAYKIALEQPGVLLMPTTRTTGRERLFEWVGPIISQRWMLYGLSDREPLRSLAEARLLKSIGVVRGDARTNFLSSLGFQNLVEVKNGVLNVAKLKAGRIEAMVSSNVGFVGFGYIKDVDTSGIKPLLEMKEVGLYLAFSAGTSPTLVEQWREALSAMRADGTFERIYSVWLPGQPLPEE